MASQECVDLLALGPHAITEKNHALLLALYNKYVFPPRQKAESFEQLPAREQERLYQWLTDLPRERRQELYKNNELLDFSGCSLACGDIKGANLAGASFEGAKFYGSVDPSNVKNTCCIGVNFQNTEWGNNGRRYSYVLEGADLRGACFEGSKIPLPTEDTLVVPREAIFDRKTVFDKNLLESYDFTWRGELTDAMKRYPNASCFKLEQKVSERNVRNEVIPGSMENGRFVPLQLGTRMHGRYFFGDACKNLMDSQKKQPPDIQEAQWKIVELAIGMHSDLEKLFKKKNQPCPHLCDIIEVSDSVVHPEKDIIKAEGFYKLDKTAQRQFEPRIQQLQQLFLRLYLLYEDAQYYTRGKLHFDDDSWKGKAYRFTDSALKVPKWQQDMEWMREMTRRPSRFLMQHKEKIMAEGQKAAYGLYSLDFRDYGPHTLNLNEKEIVVERQLDLDEKSQQTLNMAERTLTQAVFSMADAYRKGIAQYFPNTEHPPSLYDITVRVNRDGYGGGHHQGDKFKEFHTFMEKAEAASGIPRAFSIVRELYMMDHDLYFNSHSTVNPVHATDLFYETVVKEVSSLLEKEKLYDPAQPPDDFSKKNFTTMVKESASGEVRKSR